MHSCQQGAGRFKNGAGRGRFSPGALGALGFFEFLEAFSSFKRLFQQYRHKCMFSLHFNGQFCHWDTYYCKKTSVACSKAVPWTPAAHNNDRTSTTILAFPALNTVLHLRQRWSWRLHDGTMSPSFEKNARMGAALRPGPDDGVDSGVSADASSADMVANFHSTTRTMS